MAFNNGAVIPGRRPSIKKNIRVVRPPKPQVEKPAVSIDDIDPIEKEKIVLQPEVVIAIEPKVIEEEVIETIIPESPVEEASIMETNEVEIEDETSEEETEEMEVEEKKLSRWERKNKNKKKNKKKSTAAYEPEQEE